MKHFKVIAKKVFEKDYEIGCGECQASCQSACKTSCTVGNQTCKKGERINNKERKDV